MSTASKYYQTNAQQNASLVRASASATPESYDGVTGIMSIAENNGQGIRAAFTLRNNLYFVKERSLYVTATDGVNEPALWQVEEVSNQVGTPSAHGVGFGEEWVVIAGRSGLYYFDGSESDEAVAGNSADLGRDQLGIRAKTCGCKWILSTSGFWWACRWAQPRSRTKCWCLITPKDCRIRSSPC